MTFLARFASMERAGATVHVAFQYLIINAGWEEAPCFDSGAEDGSDRGIYAARQICGGGVSRCQHVSLSEQSTRCAQVGSISEVARVAWEERGVVSTDHKPIHACCIQQCCQVIPMGDRPLFRCVCRVGMQGDQWAI